MEFDMLEIWKDVNGYGGMYMVSSLGRVKSLHRDGRILRAQKDRYGYLRVTLSKNGIYKKPQIHQLVAIAFLNHSPDGHSVVVDHINNDRLYNRPCNLQLITQRENLSKDRKNGTSKFIGVSWNKKLKKWKASIFFNGKGNYLGVFTDELEASNAYQNALAQIENFGSLAIPMPTI